MPDRPYLMEPMLPSEDCRELMDLAFDLQGKSHALAGKLHPDVQRGLGDLVRSMNCYYSNLIEGHYTHPREIDEAMAGDFSQDPEKRDLQLEATAHIHVQQQIDHGEHPDCLPTSQVFLKWIHQAFCQELPETLLMVDHPQTGETLRVQPGVFRDREVRVGRHEPPQAAALPDFIRRFEEAYDPARLGTARSLIAIAASHHRLAWIHPFLDGNGRVARLFSHAWLLQAGIGSTLWSISRGLGRNSQEYKARLMAADQLRKGDLDGRGNLSHEALVDFCRFFLQVCIDQVDFMAGLFDIEKLLYRMERHITEQIDLKELPAGSFALLQHAFYRGSFKRGKAAEITGFQERYARAAVSALHKKGYLVSDTPKGPVRLGFPLEAVERWFPSLYPAG